MAGRIPELKDLEASLAECTDEASCRNAWVEYTKRGGLSYGEAGPLAVRKRIGEVNAAQKQLAIEPTTKPGGGDALGHGAETPPGVNALRGPGASRYTKYPCCRHCNHKGESHAHRRACLKDECGVVP